MRNILLSSALLLAGVGVANAAPVTFNLSQNPGQSTNYNNLTGGSFSLTVGGLTGTFTAGAFTNSLDSFGSNRNIENNNTNGYTIGGPSNTLNPATDIRIGRYNGGAGVVTRPGDDHQVDGSGWDNFITAAFTFNGQDIDVGALSVSFGLFGGNDNFRWGYDLNDNGTYGTGDFLSYSQNNNPFSSFGPVQSSMFMFGAFDSNDEWKLKTVTVDFVPPPMDNVPQVPLPAAFPLLAGGLGLMGLVGWRRKRKAAAS